MTGGVDASLHGMQAPGVQAVTDCTSPEPDGFELRSADDAVLDRGELRDAAVR
jgi:hypothetical protein